MCDCARNLDPKIIGIVLLACIAGPLLGSFVTSIIEWILYTWF